MTTFMVKKIKLSGTKIFIGFQKKSEINKLTIKKFEKRNKKMKLSRPWQY